MASTRHPWGCGWGRRPAKAKVLGLRVGSEVREGKGVGVAGGVGGPRGQDRCVCAYLGRTRAQNRCVCAYLGDGTNAKRLGWRFRRDEAWTQAERFVGPRAETTTEAPSVAATPCVERGGRGVVRTTSRWKRAASRCGERSRRPPIATQELSASHVRPHRARFTRGRREPRRAALRGRHAEERVEVVRVAP